MVNYLDLPNILIDYIIADHFNVPVGPTEAQNIHEVCQTYSKGSHNRDKEWKEDSEKKREQASDEIVKASDKWLREIYDKMEKGEQQ